MMAFLLFDTVIIGNTFINCVTFYSIFSKQNQLWLEGAELYKGKPFAKAEPYQHGIYSIKQRELHKSTNGNAGELNYLIFIAVFFVNIMFEFFQKIQMVKPQNYEIVCKIFHKKLTP